MRKGIIFLSLVIISIPCLVLSLRYPNVYLQNAFNTFLAISILYFAFKIVLEDVFSKGIKEPKSRYTFRKTISILSLISFLIVITGIWIENPQTLAVAFGLVGAGLAIALQDVLKNFAGGVAIFVNGIYRVGDRIEVNSKCGDVIDVGIMFTTLLELIIRPEQYF